MEKISYDLIPRIIDDLEFEIEGWRYVLKVNIVVIADEEILIYTTVKGVNDSSL